MTITLYTREKDGQLQIVRTDPAYIKDFCTRIHENLFAFPQIIDIKTGMLAFLVREDA